MGESLPFRFRIFCELDFPPVGFKGNRFTYVTCVFFPGAKKQMEDPISNGYPIGPPAIGTLSHPFWLGEFPYRLQKKRTVPTYSNLSNLEDEE